MRMTWRTQDLPLRHTFTISRGSQDVARTVICEVEHDGLTGRGEAAPSAFYGDTPESVGAALDGMREWVEGRNPLAYRALLEDAARRFGGDRAALCALDGAVHEWAARRLGHPLYRLLGLDPDRCPRSSFTVGIDTVERMVEKLREARGYPIIKVKLGTERDLEIVRALRAETDAVLRVDANGAWTAEQAVERSHELAALGVEFIEQPLPQGALEAMEHVARHSALPLVADEDCRVPEDVPRLRGRFHGINIKLVKCGGIRPALRMVELARAFDLRVMYGCMIESSVGITAAAQIGSLADWLDLDGNVLISHDPWRGVRNEHGRLVLPELAVEPA